MEASEKDCRGQIEEGISGERSRGFKGKFLAYFQSYTNTYADAQTLSRWWSGLDDFPEDMVGLSVSTRPDCLEDAALDLLAEHARRRMVWLELGLQSACDATLALINRGHDFACFEDAVRRTKNREGILICAHLILGLPGENLDEMRRTIAELNRLGVDGVKFHHLQVVKGTVLEKWYREDRVRVLGEEDYVDIICDLLPRLRRGVVIHRLFGDVRGDLLVAPRWKRPKGSLTEMVRTRLGAQGDSRDRPPSAKGSPG